MDRRQESKSLRKVDSGPADLMVNYPATTKTEQQEVDTYPRGWDGGGAGAAFLGFACGPGDDGIADTRHAAHPQNWHPP